MSLDEEMQDIGVKIREAHRLESEGNISEAVEMFDQISERLLELAQRAEGTSLASVLKRRASQFANNAAVLRRQIAGVEDRLTTPEQQGVADLTLLRGPSVTAQLLKSFQSAQYRVLIATHQLHAVELLVDEAEHNTSSLNLLVLLNELHKGGIKIRVLTTPPTHLAGVSRWRQADALRSLNESGIEFRLCSRLHFNSILVDDTAIWRGTAPLTTQGLSGLDDVIEFSASKWLISVYLDLFRSRWEQSDLSCMQCSEKTCQRVFQPEDPRRSFEYSGLS
jgi:hypothetical protein